MNKVNSVKDNNNGFNQPQFLRSLKKADNKKRRKNLLLKVFSFPIQRNKLSKAKNNFNQTNLQHKFINNKQGSGTEPLDKVNNILMNNISFNNNLPSSNLEKVITSGATITHKTLWFYDLVCSMLKLQKLHMKHTVFQQKTSCEAQTLEASSFRSR